MFTVELVVDKVPWLDSVWDSVSTVVRPTVGALVAYQLGGDAPGTGRRSSPRCSWRFVRTARRRRARRTP
ncbi:MAG: hypothetical protein JWQ91_2425 [Aeromicrobium sp.]|uniref:DUF4126 domain-containing protein n=1 Tax=Aeromicrobium sp. TaxID=1871063 RepID=UPI00260F2B8E|nr:DUF4126 domain-containing protein [Aeromicrobium sp.]MCW2788645.1 hypothetical protein [Aeromicrobium sp.]MCW2825508.1 hypothetical protein [Aeromicrobium sp.]